LLRPSGKFSFWNSGTLNEHLLEHMSNLFNGNITKHTAIAQSYKNTDYGSDTNNEYHFIVAIQE